MLANQIGMSDKFVSENHAIASMEKMTAGEVSSLFKKSKIIISAKEIISLYHDMTGSYPEWHHSGFYKVGGRSRMGKTYFFSNDEVRRMQEELTPDSGKL
jgi:hypothetical protein